MTQHPVKQRRRGAALVEFAVVSIVFFMFLFGIVEFAQIVWINSMLDSAAREGARYAAVHTTDGSALTANVRTEVLNRMGGVQARLVGFNPSTDITVTAVDAATGNQIMSGGSPLPPESTAFGQLIQVQISTSYQPLTASLLGLPSTIPMNGLAVINSESN
jgi:Flp pilus assembly protein TadG